MQSRSKRGWRAFFKQGENGEDIFIIEQGTAELFVRVSLEQENKVAEFHKSDHFGELSIFNGRQRSRQLRPEALLRE